MARFGRAQPHQPIILEGAPAATVAAAPPAPQIHVFSLAVERERLQPRARSLLYLRPSRSSLVPDRLPRQILLQQANPLASRHPARDADVQLIRNALVPAAPAAKLAPQILIVGEAPERSRLQPRASTKAYVRPSRSSFVPDRLAPQTIIIRANPLASRHPARDADVILLVGRQPQAAAPSTPAPKIFVVEARPARRLERQEPILLRTPALPSLPPLRQIVVVSAVRRQLRHRQRTRILQLLAPAAPAIQAAPGTRPLLILQRRGRRHSRRGQFLLFRGSPLATGPTIINEALRILDQGSGRYPLLDLGNWRYLLLDEGEKRYLLSDMGDGRYLLTDLGKPATELM